jgi:hypothetical protein
MEADWEVEIGPGLPAIHVPWDGFVDLRTSPAEVSTIAEAVRYPALARVLTLLNGVRSPVFTAKCDVWELPGDEIDPDEFGAPAAQCRCGVASYIDLLPRDTENFRLFAHHEDWMKRLTAQLRATALGNCRVDLVLRPAVVEEVEGYGVTLYSAGCGADRDTASAHWESVLMAALLVTMKSGAAIPAGPPAGE